MAEAAAPDAVLRARLVHSPAMRRLPTPSLLEVADLGARGVRRPADRAREALTLLDRIAAATGMPVPAGLRERLIRGEALRFLTLASIGSTGSERGLPAAREPRASASMPASRSVTAC